MHDACRRTPFREGTGRSTPIWPQAIHEKGSFAIAPRLGDRAPANRWRISSPMERRHGQRCGEPGTRLRAAAARADSRPAGSIHHSAGTQAPALPCPTPESYSHCRCEESPGSIGICTEKPPSADVKKVSIVSGAVTIRGITVTAGCPFRQVPCRVRISTSSLRDAGKHVQISFPCSSSDTGASAVVGGLLAMGTSTA